MKVILPAHEIPDGSTVTKVTGAKELVLRSSIRVYGSGPGPQRVPSLKLEEGTLLLDNQDGSFTVIPSTTELKWLVSEEHLYHWLGLKDRRDE